MRALFLLALLLACAKPPAVPVAEVAVPHGRVAIMGSYEVNPDVPGRVRASLWLPPDWKPGETLMVDTRNAKRRSDED